MAQTIDQKIAEWLWWGDTFGGKSYQDRQKQEQQLLNDWKAGKGIGGLLYNGAENAGELFDIFVWLKQNWKLAFVGFIALLLLLRD